MGSEGHPGPALALRRHRQATGKCGFKTHTHIYTVTQLHTLPTPLRSSRIMAAAMAGMPFSDHGKIIHFTDHKYLEAGFKVCLLYWRI